MPRGYGTGAALSSACAAMAASWGVQGPGGDAALAQRLAALPLAAKERVLAFLDLPPACPKALAPGPTPRRSECGAAPAGGVCESLRSGSGWAVADDYLLPDLTDVSPPRVALARTDI